MCYDNSLCLAELVIEESQISLYNNCGAVLVKNIIPPSLLQDVTDAIESVFHSEGLTGSLPDMINSLNSENQRLLHQLHVKTSSRDIFQPVENVLAEAFSLLLDSSEWILVGGSCGYLLGLPRDNRLVYDFHQECHYMKGINPILTAHYPLNVACTAVNGAMSYLHNSSRLGAIAYEKQKISNGYTNLLPLGIERIADSHDEIQPVIEVGDCLFFDEFCIHKSNFNASESPRLCGIFRVTTRREAHGFVTLQPDEL